MPKKAPTKQNKLLQRNLLRKLLLPLIILTLVGTAIFQGICINELEKQDQRQINEQVAQTLLQSVNNLNQPLPTEPSTGKAYLSAQHLMLPPAPAPLGQLAYSTAYADDDGIFPVHVAAKNDIDQASQAIISTQQDGQKAFAALPTVQACARGVGMSYAKTDQPAVEKQLANGKTLYFYTEAQCKNPELLDYLKQVDSY